MKGVRFLVAVRNSSSISDPFMLGAPISHCSVNSHPLICTWKLQPSRARQVCQPTSKNSGMQSAHPHLGIVLVVVEHVAVVQRTRDEGLASCHVFAHRKIHYAGLPDFLLDDFLRQVHPSPALVENNTV